MIGRLVVIAMFFLVSVYLTGCAGGTANYTPPVDHAIQTERNINLPPEQAWDMYVGEQESIFSAYQSAQEFPDAKKQK
jgi:hypothetical protein